MRERGSKALLCLGTGGIAAIVDAGGFALLINASVGILLASVISFCIAALVNYRLMSRFVFFREATIRGFALFLSAGVIGFVVNVGLTLLGATVLHLPALIAKSIGIGVAFGINFFLNLRFVFGPEAIGSTMSEDLEPRGISQVATPRSK